MAQIQKITAGEDAKIAFKAPKPSLEDAFFLMGGLGREVCAECAATYAGGEWRVALPAGFTARLPQGPAPWELWNRPKKGMMALAGKGQVLIMPSLAAGHDFRTYNRQVLDALKAALLRRAAEDEVSITIHGRAVTFRDPDKIDYMIGLYQNKVNQEMGGSQITCVPVTMRRR
jgi:hypothetical protein